MNDVDGCQYGLFIVPSICLIHSFLKRRKGDPVIDGAAPQISIMHFILLVHSVMTFQNINFDTSR